MCLPLDGLLSQMKNHGFVPDFLSLSSFFPSVHHAILHYQGLQVCVCYLLFLLCVCVVLSSLQFNSLFCSDSIMHLFTEHRHICYRDVTFNDLPSLTMSSANTQTCKPQRIPHCRALKVTLLERLEKEYKNFWFWFNDLEQLCIYVNQVTMLLII